MIKGHLCKECFIKTRGKGYTEEDLRKGVIERRIPKWGFTLRGGIPVCENCGREGVVYG